LAPVPSRALPPLPWNLATEGRSEAYAQASNSILTRRILQRLPEAMPLGARDYQGQSLEGNGSLAESELERQWQELTTQQARVAHYTEGPLGRSKNGHGRPGKLAKLPSHQFDADRLLHPWQRQMNAMKRKMRADEQAALEIGEAALESGSAAEWEYTEGARQSHSADYQYAARSSSTSPAPQPRPHPLSAGPGSGMRDAAAPSVRGSKSLPALSDHAVPRTGLQHLQSIDAAWVSTDRPPTSSPSAKHRGPPVDTGPALRDKAAVGRVGAALLGGLYSAPAVGSSSRAASFRSATEAIHESEEETEHTPGDSRGSPGRRPSVHPHNASAGAHGTSASDEDGNSGDDDEEEEIGWSPFAVR
jgi:hypothetical protein